MCYNFNIIKKGVEGMKDMVGIRQRVSYKDMRITWHGGFRMAERKEITRTDEKKRIAYSARYKGEVVTREMCRGNRWHLKVHSSKLYMVYQQNIFVFGGKGKRTLLTVIPLAA